jgi:hypothetical protein
MKLVTPYAYGGIPRRSAACQDADREEGSVTTQTSGGVVPEVHELSVEEGRALFDKTARKLLGISGDEFLDRWDRGEYQHEREQMDVTKLAMLIPFAR